MPNLDCLWAAGSKPHPLLQEPFILKVLEKKKTKENKTKQKTGPSGENPVLRKAYTRTGVVWVLYAFCMVCVLSVFRKTSFLVGKQCFWYASGSKPGF